MDRRALPKPLLDGGQPNHDKGSGEGEDCAMWPVAVPKRGRRPDPGADPLTPSIGTLPSHALCSLQRGNRNQVNGSLKAGFHKGREGTRTVGPISEDIFPRLEGWAYPGSHEAASAPVRRARVPRDQADVRPACRVGRLHARYRLDLHRALARRTMACATQFHNALCAPARGTKRAPSRKAGLS